MQGSRVVSGSYYRVVLGRFMPSRGAKLSLKILEGG